MVIISFLCLLTLPFIFIKTFFPFYRFGMFAEPVKTEIQLEKFQIRYQQNQAWVRIEGIEFGLSKSVFATLMRKAYYQHQEVELLRKTALVMKAATATWEMWRYDGQDSTKIGEWQP